MRVIDTELLYRLDKPATIVASPTLLLFDTEINASLCVIIHTCHATTEKRNFSDQKTVTQRQFKLLQAYAPAIHRSS